MSIIQHGFSDAKRDGLLLYIASDVRSGSTLLDMLIGAHSQVVSLGEIHYLRDHFRKEGTGYSWNWRCTCGQDFNLCPFWSDIDKLVQIKLNKSIKELDTKAVRFWSRFPLITLPNKQIKNISKHFNSIKQSIYAGRNCWDIIDSIYKYTGKPIVVDSSKTAEQLRFLYYWRPKSIRAIYLIRDGRGVIFSKIKRVGDSARKASKTWILENLKILSIMCLLPNRQKLVLKYEDLCTNPQVEINKIFNFLNIYPEVINLAKFDRHNVGGSPHRFNRNNTDIKIDERWKEALSKRELNVFRVLGGWLNKFMGY